MPLSSGALYIAPIHPPRIDSELPRPSVCCDDRVRIAELEAAFEEFESDLSTQVCQQLPPVGSFTTSMDDLVTPVNGNFQRATASSRATLVSPLYSMGNSMNLTYGDAPVNSDPANTPLQTSASRLPRRVAGARLTPSGQPPPPLPIIRSAERPIESRVRGTRSFVDLMGLSPETYAQQSEDLAAADSSDNFLADEEEAEAVVGIDEELNDIE